MYEIICLVIINYVFLKIKKFNNSQIPQLSLLFSRSRSIAYLAVPLIHECWFGAAIYCRTWFLSLRSAVRVLASASILCLTCGASHNVHMMLPNSRVSSCHRARRNDGATRKRDRRNNVWFAWTMHKKISRSS